MPIVKDIYNYINQIAPFGFAESWDNVGILAGDPSQEVTGAILALDATMDVLHEAQEAHANLVITHHPVIFKPISAVDPKQISYHAVRMGISILCAHTNLDVSPYSPDSIISKRLGMKNIRFLELLGHDDGIGDFGIGRFGSLSETLSPVDFVEFIKKTLCLKHLRVALGSRPIERIGFCAGGGSEYLQNAIDFGAQAYITADVKHSTFILAKNLDITLIDAGHFQMETAAMTQLESLLLTIFPKVPFSIAKSDIDFVKYII